MAGTIFLVCVLSLVFGVIGALTALKIQAKYLRSQQFVSQEWESRQEKRLTDVEMRFAQQVQQLLSAWQAWESKDDVRHDELKRQYEITLAQLNTEREIARVLRVEEAPLSLLFEDKNGHASSSWQPIMLHGATLCDRDLSHRFLRRADLSNAQLSNTNLYMADLSGANLAGANLCGADLSGADLTGADLRNAVLSGADLHVADLHQAVLAHADLRGVRNLSADQLKTAVHDNTTQLDAALSAIAATPRLSSINPPLHSDANNGALAPAKALSNGSSHASQAAEETDFEVLPVTPAPASTTQAIEHLQQQTEQMAPVPRTPDTNEQNTMAEEAQHLA